MNDQKPSSWRAHRPLLIYLIEVGIALYLIETRVQGHGDGKTALSIFAVIVFALVTLRDYRGPEILHRNLGVAAKAGTVVVFVLVVLTLAFAMYLRFAR